MGVLHLDLHVAFSLTRASAPPARAILRCRSRELAERLELDALGRVPDVHYPRARGDPGAQVGYLERVALLDGRVVRLVREDEGQDAEIDEVGGVYALEGLGDDRPHAEGGRADRRVLARGALAVGQARDDDVVRSRVARRGRPGGEAGVHALEHEGRVGRDVAAVLHPRARGHDVVGRDLVADLDRRDAARASRAGARRRAGRRCWGRGLSRPAARSDGGEGRDDHAVVDEEALGRRRRRRPYAELGLEVESARDAAEDGRGGRRLGAHEVDLGVGRARAALEVAVGAAQATLRRSRAPGRCRCRRSRRAPRAARPRR